MEKLKKVLFVGSFIAPSDGKIGGQYFACRSLVDSELSEQFNFVLIDSTLDTIHVNSFLFRLNKISKRLLLFIKHLLFSKIDVVLIFSSSGLSFLEKGFMAIMARVFGRKVTLFPRSGNILENAKGKAFLFYIRVVFKVCHKVVCQSNFWKESFSSLAPGISSQKFVVIENWLAEKYFTANIPITRNLNFSIENPLRILYFNRIEVEKGVYDFLDAMSMLGSENIFIEGSVYGDGREVENIKKYIHNKKILNTKFRGWLSNDKFKVIPQYHLYIFTSYSEGFPNALLEVMAMGVPIISTKVGALNDLIADGDNGFLVNIKSPNEIAGAIQKLYSNSELLNVFSSKSSKRVFTNNTMSRAILEFKKLLIEL
jgi:glycosyltransferase involved in cell wall biosynthesis